MATRAPFIINFVYRNLLRVSIFVFGILILWHVYTLVPVFFPIDKNIGELKIYDRHDVLITHLPKSGGFQIPIAEDEPIPENLVNAFTTIEDERFFSHWGIDAFAKVRALRDNWNAQKIVSGGSTITEQWVKNEYFAHSPRTVLQKLREATVAFYSSLFFSKEEILRRYLDTIYFGHRNYGIKAAMLAYFNKSHLEALTEEEIITLLAIIRSPGVINVNERYFQDRWQRIASVLLSEVLCHSECPEVAERISLKKLDEQGDSFAPLGMTINLHPFRGLNRFPHVTASILQMISSAGAGSVREGHAPPIQKRAPPLRSTIDSSLQQKTSDLIEESLTRLSGKNVTNGAAYIVQPSTGDILAWVGSKDFFDESIDGQVNIITQKRQMGSALKPFIYLYAFLKGAQPDQLIVDLEKDFESGKQDEAYRPLNYGLREGGIMTLKMALANSFNIASVRLLEHLGLEETYDFMKNLGLPFDEPARHYGLSLALGTPDLRMQDVADAYATLANNGKKVRSHLLMSLRGAELDSGEGRRGNPVGFSNMLRSRDRDASARDDDVNPAFSSLFDVLSDPLNRRRSFGVNSILNTTIPFAVKTGTTKDFHDNWAFGYHPDLVVATWVGNNDNTPMIDVDGITGAGPIWHRLTEFAIAKGYVRTEELSVPPDQSSSLPTPNSELRTNHYCLEDFYIQDINPAEISKIAKLFGFKDLKIERCAGSEVSDSSPNSDFRTPDSPLLILSPAPNETFYIRPDVPSELQQIILRASETVDWYVDDVKVGSGKNIFIQPILGKHEITAKKDNQKSSVTISVMEYQP